MEKCLFCKTESEKAVCPKCKMLQKAFENGDNARVSRVEKSTDHLYENPGLLMEMYLVPGNQ